MIEKKVEGQEIKAVPPAPRRSGQVVDIFEALKKSLENRRPAENHRRSGEAKKKSLGSNLFSRTASRILCSGMG